MKTQFLKTWQPAGFDGLELDNCLDTPGYQPPSILFGYGLQVVFSAHAKVWYGKSQQVFKITQPTMILQNPGELWAFEKVDDTPIRCKVFGIPESMFSDALDEFAPFCFPNLSVTNLTVNQHLAQLTARAFESFETSNSRLEKDVLLTQLVKEVFRHCADIRLKEKKAGTEHHAISKVKEFLHSSPESDVSLAELAMLTQLNKHYLLAIFKREVGMSPHQYQTSLRVDKAKQLLGKGLPVAQVALESGFSDQSHLTNVFKKHIYVTPGQFRRDSLQS